MAQRTATNTAYQPSQLGQQLGNITFWTLLTLGAFLWLVPIIWMVAVSLTPNDVLRQTTPLLLPVDPTLDNYIRSLSVSQVPRWFFNSVIVSVGATVLVLVLASLAGFALARVPFRGRALLFIFILSGLMIPEQAVFIPLHQLIAGWDLHNTHLGLILPRLASPLGVFLMSQFFRAIPIEIEEAARLDGADRLTVFLRVMLPLSRPALTTLGIFTFVGTWNDFLWPLVSATRVEMYTITVGLAATQANFAQSEGLGSLMTSAVLASAPILLLFLFFQRYIVDAVRVNTRF